MASACLAREVGVDVFVIVTDVAGAFLDYGGPDEKLLRQITVDEAEALLREGAFPPGSMGPKMQACINFVRNGGKRAVIGSMNEIEDAVNGKSGTIIVP